MRAHGHIDGNNTHPGAYWRMKAGRRKRIRKNNLWVLGLMSTVCIGTFNTALLTIVKTGNQPGTVVHTCNPSTLGG